MSEPRKLRLRISVRIEDAQYGGGFNLDEEATLETMSFLDACKVLGTFHDLIQSMKVERSRSER